MRYREADELMRLCVANKRALGSEMRAAACWALGYLHEDSPDEELVEMFERRITDFEPFPPESPDVWWMAAIALGRMKAESALPTLRSGAMNFGRNQEPGSACYWAIERVTGEPAPPPGELKSVVRGWFLGPLSE
jgi:hypothetical protein